ncbi:G/U mismatch-specific DNA glycosylase [Pseudalkalibacillus caeni]|uniref:G/U mismatch-specific DNA glycosylase n=1 Tax=Exobacillus caeni TaxID=2574798 RepID=A0A5R9F4M8_9BACL|nr:G/U mismatch-specific DNA glycosylase [Pseudalkalibacillus caeni]TLS35444.1 G/U mismatch-specific DNA glycosylase [Pseudalkalibacillus caeni]
MEPIEDHLKENLKIMFVGFNPSLKSGQTGTHYANPNNRFWTILHRAGLTERKYESKEDKELLKLGYGLTNIVERPTKEAADITKEEYQKGRENLLKKIKKLQPKVVCFVGKGVYQQYSGKKKVEWGIQPDSRVPGVIEFVAPSSSGLVRIKLEKIVSIYRQLTEFI